MVRIGAHPELERGKRHNVSLACTAIDGLALSPAKPFSFWRTVGPVNQQRGFIAGMELQAGCAVPTIGGGICLLSNALYQLAVEAGWAIVERHGHTAAVAAIDALDATVAYPHVDLRFAPTGPVVLSARVRGDVLVVSAWAATASHRQVTVEREVRALPGTPVLYRVQIHRAITNGDQVERSLLSDETRRKLDASQPTCLSCNETACDDGNRLLQRAGLQRDPVNR
jgi:vancomycin resistance protein VanW